MSFRSCRFPFNIRRNRALRGLLGTSARWYFPHSRGPLCRKSIPDPLHPLLTVPLPANMSTRGWPDAVKVAAAQTRTKQTDLDETLRSPEFSLFMLSLSFSHQELAVSLERSQRDFPSEDNTGQGARRPEFWPSSALRPLRHLGQSRDFSEPPFVECIGDGAGQGQPRWIASTMQASVAGRNPAWGGGEAAGLGGNGPAADRRCLPRTREQRPR